MLSFRLEIVLAIDIYTHLKIDNLCEQRKTGPRKKWKPISKPVYTFWHNLTASLKFWTGGMWGCQRTIGIWTKCCCIRPVVACDQMEIGNWLYVRNCMYQYNRMNSEYIRLETAFLVNRLYPTEKEMRKRMIDGFSQIYQPNPTFIGHSCHWEYLHWFHSQLRDNIWF